ncbi:single-stranded DNA-binding protein Ssb [Gluconobacter thailandicus F149-1 = NBRC 100600]|uniref:Single-stranded DNA-binding protein n=1 Tax=Gluconobacter thailandicus NBRC 3257 TaxID=1381097 RepID=A0ABQ0IVF4_GLUTH|nr:single-stranded DNA-binding protein [Gluconobacter thailandicus]KXV52019.1 single-stranded DNA-binding protein [Gluconobacter thailandicus]GAC86619.1 single-strand DNA binding protein [Gluconobacter thailandicus NBRC 3255]GAD26180.1 single-strand DNA binding protein [Gluconobacter thailandicus NBRC 3257]GAN92278.1 single-stranded DNA-binding protein Ssb [Gluconobacter thailandicus F149-1 = NBRC 100600]GBR58811.1 single-strand DNA binding protein Ssb [Gluconobacter thailandicus F149-1 = NBRC
MAGSVNKVILVGNLGKDPEVRNTQSGSKIVNLTVATSETWNDRQSGERKERTEWHRVVIFNDRLGDVAERFLRKGRKVYLEGELRTRKWTDQSGQERYTTEVTIDRFRGELVLLDSNRSGGGDEGGFDGSGSSYGGGSSNGGGFGGGNRGGGFGGGNDGGRSGGSSGGSSGGGNRGGGWDAPPDNDLDDEIPF